MRWPLWRKALPIAILSFNRAQYLEQVLRSLRPQVSKRDRVILIQDGAKNPFSGRVKATPESIRQCVDLFRDIIPWGTVLESPANLGIALNYERAETYVFETLQSQRALILEDDLVLSPDYIRVIHWLLRFAEKDRRIAYVSAYGNMWASLDDKRRRQGELLHMHENWGFAMTRQAWLDERPFRQQYLRLLDERDYSERDGSRILDSTSSADGRRRSPARTPRDGSHRSNSARFASQHSHAMLATSAKSASTSTRISIAAADFTAP